MEVAASKGRCGYYHIYWCAVMYTGVDTIMYTGLGTSVGVGTSVDTCVDTALDTDDTVHCSGYSVLQWIPMV